jgi:hypothetical protein
MAKGTEFQISAFYDMVPTNGTLSNMIAYAVQYKIEDGLFENLITTLREFLAFWCWPIRRLKWKSG